MRRPRGDGTLPRVDVRPVDAFDSDAVADWFAPLDAGQRHARPGEPGWLEHEQRARLQAGAAPDADVQLIAFTAYDGAQPVAAARLDLPRTDNTHRADLLVVTDPQHRRRGAGRLLAVEAERRARAAGRTTLTAASEEPAGEEGCSPARAFGPALGFEVALVEVRRDIDLPLQPAVVAAQTAGAAQLAADYDVCTWRDAVPEELLEGRAHLQRRLSTDVPLGGLDWHEEEWDGARIRRHEQEVRDMDRTYWGGGAVHRPMGQLVAYTTMAISNASPERVHQWETLVLTEHRGRRLGTLVKLAVLQRVVAEVPQARLLTNWNASDNAPMIRVNDALGARVNGQIVSWQKKL